MVDQKRKSEANHLPSVMKVTLTQEGNRVRKSFAAEYENSSRQSESASGFSLTLRVPRKALRLHDHSRLIAAAIPKMAITPVVVKTPRVQLSSEFAAKYTRPSEEGHSVLQDSGLRTVSSTGLLLKPSLEGDVTTGADSYLQRKMAEATRKRKGQKEISKVELKHRKILEIYNYQQQRSQRILENIRLRREQLQKESGDNVEKFRFNFETSERDFLSALKGRVHRNRFALLLQSITQPREAPHWNSARVVQLAQPKVAKKKYLELKQLANAP